MSKLVQKDSGWWDDRVKVDAVKSYLVLGNLTEVSRVTGVPYQTIRHWHRTQWWEEIEENLRLEESVELSAKLRNRINKALDVATDRLENGDFIYNKATGQLERRPVTLRDTWRVAEGMIKAKRDADSLPSVKLSQQAVTDTLKVLTEQFAKMAQSRKPRVIEGEVVVVEERIEDGAGALPQSTDS